MPATENTFQVAGTGFTPGETVNLTLTNGGASMFNFENLMADYRSSIKGTEMIPASINRNEL